MPVRPMERLLHPYGIPEPIGGNAVDLDVDAGLRGHLTIDLRALDSADADGRHQQLKRFVQSPGLLEQGFCFVRVVFANRNLIAVLWVDRPNRMIVEWPL